MHRIVAHVRHNLVAYLALFVALGGTSYAAAELPVNSVGERQLRNHSIDPVKFDNRFIRGYSAGWGLVSADGHLLRSGGNVRAAALETGLYHIGWEQVRSRNCTSMVSLDAREPPQATTPVGFAVSATSVNRAGVNSVVETFGPTGIATNLPFDIILIC